MKLLIRYNISQILIIINKKNVPTVSWVPLEKNSRGVKNYLRNSVPPPRTPPPYHSSTAFR